MSPLDSARLYITRGWCVVPVPAGQKAPAATGWHKLRIGLDDAARYFADAGNIGVLLGPASGELVDIDLDCPEALALADQYTPPTGAIFGRASKPRSHRLYIAPDAIKEAFVDPLDGSTLLELRAAGRDGAAHQTLLPPSVVDGECREWADAIIAPAVIKASVLRGACGWLAVGALVRRHISVHASEHPGPDLPDILEEADPQLGESARRWLKLPQPRSAHTARLRPRQELTADDIDLAELVATIPNTDGWDGWNAMGLAVYAATGGSDHGAVVFDDWSAKSAKYNPYTTADRWRHYHRSPPSRTGLGKIIKLAMQAGWQRNDKARGAA